MRREEEREVVTRKLFKLAASKLAKRARSGIEDVNQESSPDNLLRGDGLARLVCMGVDR